MFLEIRGIKKSFGTGDSRVNVLKGLEPVIVAFYGVLLSGLWLIALLKAVFRGPYRRHNVFS